MRALIFFCCFVLILAMLCSSGWSKTLKGLEYGMSTSEVRRLLERQDKNARFIETICEIPLGLDFYDGLPVFTRDTGLQMLKAYGYGPLYFHDDKLVAMREDIRYLDQFTNLKKRYSQGRYDTHRFPLERRIRTVFEQDEGAEYVFTNRYFDLYRFHDAARREIIAGVRGSFCWHVKQTSPSLPGYAAEYARCVAGEPRMDPGLLGEDLAQCKLYCAQLPEFFAAPACPSHCEEAFARAGGAAQDASSFSWGAD